MNDGGSNEEREAGRGDEDEGSAGAGPSGGFLFREDFLAAMREGAEAQVVPHAPENDPMEQAAAREIDEAQTQVEPRTAHPTSKAAAKQQLRRSKRLQCDGAGGRPYLTSQSNQAAVQRRNTCRGTARQWRER